MPAAVALFVTPYIAVLFGASSWAALGAIYWTAYAAATFAISYGISSSLSSYQAKQLHKDPAIGIREVLIRSATQPKSRIYGKAWVSGLIAYTNQRAVPGTHDNYELYVQIVHAAHECSDITEFILEDTRVTPSQISQTTIYDDTNHYYVTSGKYGLGSITVSQIGGFKFGGGVAVEIEKNLGTSTQTASVLLSRAFPLDITPEYRLRGLCNSVFKFTLFSTSLPVFASGPPQNIRVLASGLKLYDPRQDSTNGGSGSQLFASPSTWAWSDNPILCVVDYLTQVMGVPTTRIDWPTVIIEANVCDELVSIPNNATEKRFTCNGVVTYGQTHRENIAALLSSCLGTLTQPGGKWRPLTGSYRTPDVTITTDDIVEIEGAGIPITTSPSRSERYNTVAGSYFSANDEAQNIDFIPVTDTNFLLRDNGREIRKVLDLPMTNSETMCQRIAFKQLQQSDQMITATVPMRMTGLKLTPGTLAQITYPDYGWSNKVFRCVGFKLGGDAPVSVVMQEDAQSAWADPTPAQYATRNATGVITQAAHVIPGPINLAALGVVDAIKVTWTLPILGIDSIRIYASPTPLVTTAQLIYDGKGTTYTYPAKTRQYFWGVGVKDGIEGPWVPSIAGLTNIRAFPVETVTTTIKARPPESATTNVTAIPISLPPIVNMMPMGLADFERIVDKAVTVVSAPATAVKSTDQAWFGTQSLKVTPETGNGKHVDVYFANASTLENIPMLPNRRLLVVVSVYPSNADSLTPDDFIFKVWGLSGTAVATSNTQYKMSTDMGVGQWNRRAFEINTRNWKVGTLSLTWRNLGTTSSPPIFYLDGLELLDVTDYPTLTTSQFPDQFIGASGSSTGAFSFDGGHQMVGVYATPEADIASPAGSVAVSTAGIAYLKTSGSGNTGWRPLSTATVYNATAATQTTIAATGSQAHGLSAQPQWVRASLLCTSVGEKGYSVGDEYHGGMMDGAGQLIGWNCDATNISWAANSAVWFIQDKATTNWTAITNARWKLILRAGIY